MENFNYLPHSDLLELRRWNTPTIYNGWERIAKRERLECNLSWEDGLTDYTPQMGCMVGYAVTVEYVCGDREKWENYPDAFMDLYKYLALIPGPKILIAKDLEAPESKGSILGEVTGNAYRALGCVGCITDGCARDIDEAAYGGFKIMAKRLCVGHAYSFPLRFGMKVQMYGTTIKPGMLVCADKYGFIAIPEDETKYLLESVRHLDSVECQETIPAAREVVGLTTDEIIEKLAVANKRFGARVGEYLNFVHKRYAEDAKNKHGK